MTNEEVFKVKVCLVGEAAVGKTSLIRRFVLDEFDDRYISTLGAKVSKKELQIHPSDQGTEFKLIMLIWDIMGEKHIRDFLTEAFFAGTQGILAVCDLSRYSTLQELDSWVQAAYSVTGPIPVVYAVNKVDLKDEVVMLFGERDLEEATAAFEAPFYYTSAKTGEKVQEVFERLGEQIFDRLLAKSRLQV